MEQLQNFFCSYPEHNGYRIEKVCFNEFCQDCSLLCHKCLTENKHCGHQKDIKQVSGLITYLKDVSIISDSFNDELQDRMTQIQELIKKLRNGISKKYSLSVAQINKLQSQQVSEALNIMMKFHNTKQQVNTEIMFFYNQLKDDALASAFHHLYLSELSYLQINNDDKIQGKYLYKEGSQLFQKANYQEALISFESSLALNPYDTMTLTVTAKSQCLGMLKKYEDAIIQLDKALNIEPNDFLSLLHKGECLRRLKRYDEAIVYFYKALEINKKDLSLLNNIGDCLRKLEKYDEAIIWFDQVIEVNNKNIFSLSRKGDCLAMLEKIDEAIILLDTALAIDPFHQFSIISKSQCLKITHQLCIIM